MKLAAPSLGSRIVFFMLVCGAIAPILLVLHLGHPAQQAEFVGSSESLEASIWYEPQEMLSSCYLDIEAKNLILRPSAFFKVIEGYAIPDPSKLDRVPLLLEIGRIQRTQKLEKWLEKWPSGTPITARSVTLSASAPVRAHLQSQQRASLKLDWYGDHVSVQYAVEQPSEIGRTIYIEPTTAQPTLSCSLALEDQEPIELSLTSLVGTDTMSLTISVEEDEQIAAEPRDASPWTAAWILGIGQRHVYYAGIHADSGGRFYLYLPRGQLSISGESQLISSRYLGLYIGDRLEAILNEDSMRVGGLAEIISSGTTHQLLPSFWDRLGAAQPAIWSLVVIMLGTLFKLLGFVTVFRRMWQG